MQPMRRNMKHLLKSLSLDSTGKWIYRVFLLYEFISKFKIAIFD